MFTDLIKELAIAGRTQFFVRILPNAVRSFAKEKIADGCIKISIKAPAEHGKANQALRVFLAQQFEVHAGQVEIVSGLTSRHKLIRITK